MGQVPQSGALGRPASAGRARRRPAGRRGARRFARDEEGSITIETLLWFPVYLTLLGLIADLSVIYTVNADMWHVSYDVARRVAKNELAPQQASAEVKGRLDSRISASLSVEVLDDGSDIRVSVSAPSSVIAVTGVATLIDDATVGARIIMPKESGLQPDLDAFRAMGAGAGAPAGGT
jgi:hypothetical protein